MSEPHHDKAGATMGMWLFLFTEILLFGGLFLLYASNLRRYPDEFHLAGSELNLLFGGANTVILLTSSLTVVLAISRLHSNNRPRCLMMLGSTMGLALLFLINKGLEWSAKFQHGLYPNSPHLLEKGGGENIFYVLYFFMTGLHALHVLAGLLLFGVVFRMVSGRRINPEHDTILINSGLYWHLVDVIWIFLFPLLYLIS